MIPVKQIFLQTHLHFFNTKFISYSLSHNNNNKKKLNYQAKFIIMKIFVQNNLQNCNNSNILVTLNLHNFNLNRAVAVFVTICENFQLHLYTPLTKRLFYFNQFYGLMTQHVYLRQLLAFIHSPSKN